MKKALVLFSLTVYLFSATEMGQLLKMPAFVTHFIEHQQENKEITLWQFICIHYLHGAVKDADYDKDMKLPFKAHDHCGLQVSSTIPPEPIGLPAKKVIYSIPPKKYHSHDAGFTASFHSLIWQPPKAC